MPLVPPTSLSSFTPTSQRYKTGATPFYGIPGCVFTNVSTVVLGANTIFYGPFYTDRSITLDQLALEVTAPGAGGTTLRLGLYNADTDWQPTTLIVDAGTVTADSAAVKTAAVSVTLQPGNYLTACNTDGGPTVRQFQSGGESLAAALGAAAVNSRLFVASAYAAFASTGVAWTNTVASSIYQNVVVLRISSVN